MGGQYYGLGQSNNCKYLNVLYLPYSLQCCLLDKGTNTIAPFFTNILLKSFKSQENSILDRFSTKNVADSRCIPHKFNKLASICPEIYVDKTSGYLCCTCAKPHKLASIYFMTYTFMSKVYLTPSFCSLRQNENQLTRGWIWYLYRGVQKNFPPIFSISIHSSCSDLLGQIFKARKYEGMSSKLIFRGIQSAMTLLKWMISRW